MFRLIALFLTIFLCVISVAAVYYNEVPILVDFHIVQFDKIPLGIFLFLSMLLGILIACFFLIGLVFSLNFELPYLKAHDLFLKFYTFF